VRSALAGHAISQRAQGAADENTAFRMRDAALQDAAGTRRFRDSGSAFQTAASRNLNLNPFRVSTRGLDAPPARLRPGARRPASRRLQRKPKHLQRQAPRGRSLPLQATAPVRRAPTDSLRIPRAASFFGASREEQRYGAS